MVWLLHFYCKESVSKTMNVNTNFKKSVMATWKVINNVNILNKFIMPLVHTSFEKLVGATNNKKTTS